MGYDRSNGCIKLTFARSFMTVACIASILSVILLVISLLQGPHARLVFVRVAKVFPIISLVTGIVGIAMGIAFVSPGAGVALGAAAFLAIIAVIVNLVGAIVAAMIPMNH